ncbi:MAG: metallophosphatase family protein, partial [Planctomycetota bacterium]|nr:metallophosphatase family protein [Planctomycetota bacterium]
MCIRDRPWRPYPFRGIAVRLMIALLADVHANLEALRAVFDDLRRRDIRRIFFLGDMVGYGPNPVETLEFMKHFEFCLLGNHDEAVLKGPPKSFNRYAARAALWTRRLISPDEMGIKALLPGEHARRAEHWRFLSSLRPARTLGEMMFVHDTPADPGSARYIRNLADVAEAFAARPKERIFFVGHSHVPGIFTENGVIVPEPGKKYTFDGRMIVNVGSVGQPRDRDIRACYVVLFPDGFRFHRVPYDIETTMRKIRAETELDDILAVRLAKGI